MGYTIYDSGRVYIYDGSWVFFGYYVRSILIGIGTPPNDGYATIMISESGTPPRFNFTLKGHHSFSTGEEYGGIGSVPEYNDTLPGAWYELYPVDSSTDELVIIIP
ncbi:MAG: hypothetical protein ACK4UV_09135 [Ignavibacterium sp.]